MGDLFTTQIALKALTLLDWSPEDSEDEEATDVSLPPNGAASHGTCDSRGLSEDVLLAACRAGVATLSGVSPESGGGSNATMSSFIVTASGTRVSRRCFLYGSHNVAIAGNGVLSDGVILRGDLASMRIGRFLFAGKNVVVQPCSCLSKGEPRFVPLVIGDFVVVGRDCVLKAASIGDCVYIGARSVIGNRAVIRDCVILLPGSVLPPDAVVPPMCIFGGNPARFIAELPESGALRLKEKARRIYFLSASTQKEALQPPHSQAPPATSASRSFEKKAHTEQDEK